MTGDLVMWLELRIDYGEEYLKKRTTASSRCKNSKCLRDLADRCSVHYSIFFRRALIFSEACEVSATGVLVPANPTVQTLTLPVVVE